MIILGIETSCDETGAAVLEVNEKSSQLILRSNCIATSLALHAETGGIIPEIAAREQVKYILPVINDALEKGCNFSLTKARKMEVPPIDAIAVTYGPGLIGSLLVGVETAKTLSLLWNKPLIPVNHLYGHIYANFISDPAQNSQEREIAFPAIALVVSGGHTDLVLMQSHTDLKLIGGTRDDAAGEAFDKIGRLLNLPYPAGPTISRLALTGNPKAFQLPRPMIGTPDFDFSFSGLKTSVLNLVKKNDWDFSNKMFANENEKLLTDLCASVQQSIVDVLVKKTLKAAAHYGVASILLGGGVAANTHLTQTFEQKISKDMPDVQFFVSKKELCTDNAGMIAAAGVFAKEAPWQDVTANPELYF